MSSIGFEYNTAVVGSIFRIIPDAFGKAARTISTHLAKRQAERNLSLLDDRQLADIGLERADIHDRVWHSM